MINLEARRKDYYQMFAHHIITSMLMMSSYVLNWTRIGNTILCTMDLVDITLPVRFLLPSLLLRSQSQPVFGGQSLSPSACTFGSRGPGGKTDATALPPPRRNSSPSCSSTRAGTKRRT